MILCTPLGHPTNVTASDALCFGPRYVYASKSHVVPHCSRELSASRVNHHKFPVSIPVSVYTHSIHHLTSLSYVSFMSMMGDTSRPPSMNIFLSTSTHHLWIRLRNQLVPWDLHASMEGLLASDSGFTSLTSDEMIPRMFDFISSIHIRWNVLDYLRNHWHQWWPPSRLLTFYIIDR